MELFRALGALAERPGPDTAALARALDLPAPPAPAEYTGVFVLQRYPYASVYVGAEGMLGGEARDRVAGFWRALHLTPPAECDHLTTLFALYANLHDAVRETHAPQRKLSFAWAQRALYWEHLLPWVPVFAAGVRDAGSPFYRAWAALVLEALAEELARHGPPETLPLHLRSAHAEAEAADDDPDAFVAALLAPVRSGLVITRADLERGARDLGLGVRRGTRRFIANALLEADRDAMLGWLAGEAARTAQRHRDTPGLSPGVRDFWSGRAEASATRFDTLREARALLSASPEPRAPVLQP